MKKHLIIASIASILSCGTTIAFAGDNTDVSQVLDGVQSALNSISVGNNNSNVHQSAVNAANLISLEKINLNNVTQSATGPQSATNTADTTAGMWNKLIQEATNVANSVDLGTNTSADVSVLIQSATGDQVAKNSGGFAQAASTIKQSATNAANLASVDDITGSVNQSFSGAASQYASNSFAMHVYSWTTGEGEITGLKQAAVNVANSIDADVVANSSASPDLQQAAYGPQTALNTVTFGFGNDYSGRVYPVTPDELGLSSSSQEATNAVNIASVNTLSGSASQLAALTQKAANSASYAPSGGGWTAGEVVGLKQTGTNAANILTAKALPSLSGVTDITQNATSSMSQSVSNIISTPAYVQDIHQSATNVVNSLSLPN
jgi:hypothetical protein